MELTRRDALAALAAAGAGGAAVVAVRNGDGGDDEQTETDSALGASTVETLTAAAEVLYPSDVDGIESFVEAFARGRAEERPDHAAGVADATTYLDSWSRSWFDREFASLSESDREEALDRIGVRQADPDPDGTDAERLRYYVVNELLFALYTSPTGGKLAGIEKPQGHPGGIRSYQRGPTGR